MFANLIKLLNTDVLRLQDRAEINAKERFLLEGRVDTLEKKNRRLEEEIRRLRCGIGQFKTRADKLLDEKGE